MTLRVVKKETVRLNYEAYRLTTGLSDVTISIVRSDGNKEINGATMTELNSTNAPGIYYYDWVPTHVGTYVIYCDSTSKPRTFTDTIMVDGRSSKYTQVMGVHGGMSKVTYQDTWTNDEKQKVLNIMDALSNKTDLLTNNIEVTNNQLKETKNKIIATEMKLDKTKQDKIEILNEITPLKEKIELQNNINNVMIEDNKILFSELKDELSNNSKVLLKLLVKAEIENRDKNLAIQDELNKQIENNKDIINKLNEKQIKDQESILKLNEAINKIKTSVEKKYNEVHNFIPKEEPKTLLENKEEPITTL